MHPLPLRPYIAQISLTRPTTPLTQQYLRLLARFRSIHNSTLYIHMHAHTYIERMNSYLCHNVDLQSDLQRKNDNDKWISSEIPVKTWIKYIQTHKMAPRMAALVCWRASFCLTDCIPTSPSTHYINFKSTHPILCVTLTHIFGL